VPASKQRKRILARHVCFRQRQCDKEERKIIIQEKRNKRENEICSFSEEEEKNPRDCHMRMGTSRAVKKQNGLYVSLFIIKQRKRTVSEKKNITIMFRNIKKFR
jgi:hypothetical protein